MHTLNQISTKLQLKIEQVVPLMGNPELCDRIMTERVLPFKKYSQEIGQSEHYLHRLAETRLISTFRVMAGNRPIWYLFPDEIPALSFYTKAQVSLRLVLKTLQALIILSDIPSSQKYVFKEMYDYGPITPEGIRALNLVIKRGEETLRSTLNDDISCYPFSSGVSQLLKELGISTFTALQEYSIDRIAKIRGVGVKKIHELETALKLRQKEIT